MFISALRYYGIETLLITVAYRNSLGNTTLCPRKYVTYPVSRPKKSSKHKQSSELGMNCILTMT